LDDELETDNQEERQELTEGRGDPKRFEEKQRYSIIRERHQNPRNNVPAFPKDRTTKGMGKDRGDRERGDAGSFLFEDSGVVQGQL
jgi:hypothetical protein